jgi:hypothetical protein
VAKPKRRWRAPPRKGHTRERSRGALVDGRRSGSKKPSSMTRGRGKRSSVPRATQADKAGEARGATESVRGPSPVSYAVDNAAAGWRSSGSALCTFRKRRAQEEGSKSTEAGVAPSSALHSGLGRRKAGRHRGELGPTGRERRGRRGRKLTSLGSRAIMRVLVSEEGCRSR